MAYPGYPSLENISEISPQVQQWFTLADGDGSGIISATELQRVLANGRGGHFSDKACRLMIGLFDKNKKNAIDLVEFQALFNYVNAWLGVFRNFDNDNSGTIQEEELSAAFTQMGYKLSKEFITFLINRCDLSQQRSITVDQFIVLCVQIQKLTEEFKKRDTNLTGIISIQFEDFLCAALSCDV